MEVVNLPSSGGNEWQGTEAVPFPENQGSWSIHIPWNNLSVCINYLYFFWHREDRNSTAKRRVETTQCTSTATVCTSFKAGNCNNFWWLCHQPPKGIHAPCSAITIVGIFSGMKSKLGDLYYVCGILGVQVIVEIARKQWLQGNTSYNFQHLLDFIEIQSIKIQYDAWWAGPLDYISLALLLCKGLTDHGTRSKLLELSTKRHLFLSSVGYKRFVLAKAA